MPKKSFLLYYDLEEQTAGFTNKQLGKLLRALFAYEKRGEIVEFDDPFVKTAFGFVSVQLREAKAKYAEQSAKNAANGAKGGRPPKTAE